jgi:BirA family biotin operon repressor/biotin-[acetyl-CoA-carboxylase] ligase
MDQRTLQNKLTDLPLGSIRYFGSVTSTNDLAARWAQAGAPDNSLVVANEQTAGRGRSQRAWYTPKDAALAFSLILKESSLQDEPAHLPRFTALGALAVCETLNEAFPPMLPAQIKWPNDVVATRRKLAGVLAEAHWRGEQLTAIILGIGINIAPQAIPPDEKLDFPATSVESVLEKSIDRWSLLYSVLEKLLALRPHIQSPEFIQGWEHRLAFRGEWVSIHRQGQLAMEAQVGGLEADGSLKVRDRSDQVHRLQAGEIRLRPIDRSSK